MNYTENFSNFLEIVKPDRIKLLQVVSETTSYSITNEEFISYCDLYAKYNTINEYANDIINSYIIIDSEGRISTDNTHKNSHSMEGFEIEELLKQIKINENKFNKRYLA